MGGSVRPGSGARAYLFLARRVLARREVALIVTLAVILALLEAVGLFLLIPLLGLVGLDTAGAGTGLLAAMIRRAFDFLAIPVTLASVLLLYVFVVSLQAAVAHAESVASLRVRESIAFRLRSLLHGSLARMKWRAFTEQPLSHYSHLLTTQVDRAYIGISHLLILISQLLVALVYFALALRLQPVISSVALLSGGALMLLAQRNTRALRQSGDSLTTAAQRLHAVVVEHLANMKVAKSFGAEASHSRHFEDANREMVVSWGRAGTAFAGTRSIFAIGAAVILALIVYIGISRFGLSSAAILLLLYVFGRLVPRMAAIQQTLQQIAHARGAVDATIEELSRCEAAAEVPFAIGKPLSVRQALLLDDVVVTHPGRGAVLSGVSLEIRAGAVTALVGPSGAGKSTIADLLTGLIEPDRGSVLLDDARLAPELIPAWRRSVGYVPQEAVLFNDTIRNNLLWAVPQAAESQLRAALVAASADFVFQLPHGLDTVVGDRGTSLSGGERQRVALARALLREPQLLILDEATGHLDPENERRVLDTVRQQKGRLSIVMITHRLQNLELADRIYVLERGRVVQQGSWRSMQADGPLKRLLDAGRD